LPQRPVTVNVFGRGVVPPALGKEALVMDATPSLPTNPWASRQRWFTLALLLLFVGLSVQYTCKVLDPRGTRSAILRWREQLQALDDGEDIYQRFVYPNPPIMALLLNPLADLPPLVGALLWYYLKVGMALAAFWWAFRLIEACDVPFPPWGRALAVLLSLRPIMGDLVHGNVNLFILFVVMAALYAIHKGRDFAGGVLLALGIACKVTPALFVPYLLWKRAWRGLAGCAVGLVLFFAVVPSAFLGWDQNAQLLSSWTEQMVTPFVRDGLVTSTHNNQSIPGLVYRLTTHSPSFIGPEVRPGEPALRFHNLVDIGPPAARWVVKGCMGLFVLLVVWSCRTPWAHRGGWRLGAEFSLVVLGMLLFSERTWKHHCVTLMLPFSVLAYYLTAYRPRGRLRAYLIASLVLTVLLMATTSTSLFEAVADSEAAKLAQVYGAYVAAYLVLVAALVVLLRRPEASDEEADLPLPSPGAPAALTRREVLHQRVSYCSDTFDDRFNPPPPLARPSDRLPR
jgi:hypothetical protein